VSNDPLDRLFEAPLDEFVGVRNELARRLRQEGRDDQAAEVAALRKPTVPVWAVNQLARRQRRDVDLLLDAGHRLRAAQAESKPDEARDAFAKARDAEREAMRRLRAGAEELLAAERGSASPALIDRVLATLRAAAVAEAGRELLARGRLTQELETTGFELAASLVPKRKKASPAKRPDLGAARAELDRARKREREATRRVQAAERRAKEAQAELGEARREAEQASNAVAAAAAALERARRP
jgi:hypothetical protein